MSDTSADDSQGFNPKSCPPPTGPMWLWDGFAWRSVPTQHRQASTSRPESVSDPLALPSWVYERSLPTPSPVTADDGPRPGFRADGVRIGTVIKSTPPQRTGTGTGTGCYVWAVGLVVVAMVYGLLSSCLGLGSNPCQQYEETYQKAEREGAFFKYQDSLDQYRRACQANPTGG